MAILLLMSQAWTHKQYLLLLLLITLIGGGLRSYHLADTSFSNDELSALSRIQFDSVSEVIEQGIKPDGHPAGVQLFLYGYSSVVDISEGATRLPFALLGIASIFLIGLLGRRWFGPSTGLLSAAALAFLQFPLYYSQIARPYAPGLFFVLVACYCWSVYIFDKPRWTYLAGYVLFAVLAMYTHYFAFLAVALLGVLGLYDCPKAQLKWYLLAGVAAVLLFLPHVSITLHHLSLGGLEWLPKPGKDFLFNFFFEVFNESFIVYSAWLILILVSLWKLRPRADKFRYYWVGAGVFFVSFLFGYVKSVMDAPILQPSALLFTLPFIFILSFSFLEGATKKVQLIVLTVLSLSFVSSTIWENDYYTTYQHDPFKELAETIKEWENEYDLSEAKACMNVNGPFYIDYYLDRLDVQTKIDQYSVATAEQVVQFRKLLEKPDADYFIFGAANKVTPALLYHHVLESYPILVESRTFGRTQVNLYKNSMDIRRRRYDLCRDETYNFTFSRGYLEREHWSVPPGRSVSGNRQILGGGQHFSTTFRDTIRHLVDSNFNQIRFTAYLTTAAVEYNYTQMVFSIENQQGELYHWEGRPIIDYIKGPNEMIRVSYDHGLPEYQSTQDIIKLYVYQPGNQLVFIQGLKVGYCERSN